MVGERGEEVCHLPGLGRRLWKLLWKMWQAAASLGRRLGEKLEWVGVEGS
jgi:hypothetical protein